MFHSSLINQKVLNLKYNIYFKVEIIFWIFIYSIKLIVLKFLIFILLIYILNMLNWLNKNFL